MTVVCFGAMRDYLPDGALGNRAEIEVLEGSSIADVARALDAPGRLVYAVLLNGEQTDASQRVEQGDEVTLMPPFTGGF